MFLHLLSPCWRNFFLRHFFPCGPKLVILEGTRRYQYQENRAASPKTISSRERNSSSGGGLYPCDTERAQESQKVNHLTRVQQARTSCLQQDSVQRNPWSSVSRHRKQITRSRKLAATTELNRDPTNAGHGGRIATPPKGWMCVSEAGARPYR